MSEDHSKLLVRVDVPDIKTQVGTHAYVCEQQRLCGVFTGYPVVYVAALKIAACIDSSIYCVLYQVTRLQIHSILNSEL